MIGPEGGAWSEGAAGVDVLVMSSSRTDGTISASYRKFRVLSRKKKNNEIGDPSEKLCPF